MRYSWQTVNVDKPKQLHDRQYNKTEQFEFVDLLSVSVQCTQDQNLGNCAWSRQSEVLHFFHSQYPRKSFD
jgi:hypothetical protein